MERLGEAVDQVGLGSGIDLGAHRQPSQPRAPLGAHGAATMGSHGDVLVGVLAGG